MTHEFNREAIRQQIFDLLASMGQAHTLAERARLLLSMASAASAVGKDGAPHVCVRGQRDPSRAREILDEALQQKGFDRWAREQAIEHAIFSRQTIFQVLCDSAVQGALPSSVYARELYSILSLELGKSVSPLGPDISVAELAEALVNEKDTADRDRDRALALGTSATPFVLRSAEVQATRYEAFTVGEGQTLKRELFCTSGLNIDFPNIASDSLIPDRSESFSCGYLSDAWGLKFRANAEFSVDLTESKEAFGSVSSEVSKLKNLISRVDGKIACIVPPSWLSKTSGADLEFKKKLLGDGLLQLVVQLPEKLLGATSIAPAMLIFDTRRKVEKVQFINASGKEFFQAETRSIRKLVGIEKIVGLFDENNKTDISTCISVNELLDNNCNLDVKRSIESKKVLAATASIGMYPQVRLDSLSEILSCQSLKGLSDKDRAPGYDPLRVKELSPANIDGYGMFDEDAPLKEVRVAQKELQRAEKQTVKEGDILLTVKGAVGKCAIVPASLAGCVANQSFVILRLGTSAKVSALSLYRFLRSDLGQAMIARVSSGSSLQVVKMADLKALTVPVLPPDKQQEIAQNQHKVIELIAEKQRLEQEISQTLSEYWSLAE